MKHVQAILIPNRTVFILKNGTVEDGYAFALLQLNEFVNVSNCCLDFRDPKEPTLQSMVPTLKRLSRTTVTPSSRDQTHTIHLDVHRDRSMMASFC